MAKKKPTDESDRMEIVTLKIKVDGDWNIRPNLIEVDVEVPVPTTPIPAGQYENHQRGVAVKKLSKVLTELVNK